MTEREVKKRLKDAGWTIIEGTRHSMAVDNPNYPGVKIPIPRHKGDFASGTANAILREAGLK